MKLYILLLTLMVSVNAVPYPVVLWHGMGDSCCLPFSLGIFMRFLNNTIPGVYIHSIKIGDTSFEDLENGYFMNPNEQVARACKMLAEDKKLANGFNCIGFSQGAQFLRAVVQRCGHKLPPIKNLISLGGQHQGVYGLPHCGALLHNSCDYIRRLLNYAAYDRWVQKSLAQATYWHDPLNDDKYKSNSIFLADINNEKKINKTYIKNLSKLEHFILVKYGNDTIVQPRETEWFGFYKPGQSRQTITLQESEIYKKDKLGLKAMDEQGKLVFLATQGDHLKMPWQWFVKKILNPYLNITMQI